MATFSSISTKISPLLPCNFEFIDEQKKLLNFQEGFVDASSSDPFPILVFAPLPCRSAVQSKRGIAQSSNGKKRETIEMIVGSCISRAVAFSSHQFRTVLKSFSDLSVRKSTSFGDVRHRCQNAGKKHPNGPIDNGNGDGGNGGEGGGGGRESGSPGDGGGGGNPPLMGPVWRRAQKCSTTRGRTVLIRAANRRQIYDHATAGGGGSRMWLWVAEATVARALMEPAVVDAMLQAMLMPFQAIFFILMSPEFGNQIVQFMMVVFAVGPLIAIVLLWLIWRWWRAKKAQGIDADDGEGHKQDDGDRE